MCDGCDIRDRLLACFTLTMSDVTMDNRHAPRYCLVVTVDTILGSHANHQLVTHSLEIKVNLISGNRGRKHTPTNYS